MKLPLAIFALAAAAGLAACSETRSATNAVENAGEDVLNAAEPVAEDVGNGLESVGNTIENGAEAVGNELDGDGNEAAEQ